MSLMTLSISRSSLFLAPLVADTEGASTLEVVSWQPGTRDVQNDVSESDHLDGGFLVNSRSLLTQMPLVLRIEQATAALAWTSLAAVTAALQQFAYTITQRLDGVIVQTYNCLPATLDPQIDPILLRAGVIVVACAIPRQP